MRHCYYYYCCWLILSNETRSSLTLVSSLLLVSEEGEGAYCPQSEIDIDMLLRSFFVIIPILILSCAAFYSEADQRGGKLERVRRGRNEFGRRALLSLPPLPLLLRKRRGILLQPKQIYSKNPNILFDKRTLYVKKKRRRRRRDVGSNRLLSSAWQDRQEEIEKLKGLAKLRGRQDKSPGIYDSFFHQWLSSYSQGPVERRMHLLDIGPRRSYGYPLTKAHGHRAQKELQGYYKELNVGGLMDKQ